MPTIIEVINGAFAVYMGTCDPVHLNSAAESLTALLSDEKTKAVISEKNRENAEFLRIKLRLKSKASVYFDQGYEKSDFLNLKNFVEEAVAVCDMSGFKKTGELCKSVLSCADAVDRITFDAVSLKSRIVDLEGNCIAADVNDCRQVAAALKEKIAAAEALALPKNIFTDGAQFFDVKAQLVSDLKSLMSQAERFAKELSSAQVADVLRTAIEDVTAQLDGKRYEYYPTADIEKLAKAIVLFTPIREEAEIFAWANKGTAALLRVQALAFEGMETKKLDAVFEELAARGADLIIYGAPRFRSGNKGDFFRAVMGFTRSGRRAYIVADDGTRGVYDDAVTAATGDFSSLDISFYYLSMPDFTQTVEIMQSLNMLSDDGGIEFVRSSLPFMGFDGFNEVVKAARAGADWKKIGAERSSDNFDAATKYMLKLSRQALFIDGGWGNYHDDVVINKGKTFDYDDIRGVNPDNIRKIMEGNFTLFQKCGMISTYCLLCGASAADWKGYSAEIKSERLTEASKLVMRALGVNIVPKVEVLDELADKGAGGICYDGGKRIVYKSSSVADLDWTAKAVCHECFHAFQNYAANEGWQSWFETELHVTPGRVEQWRYNQGRYRNMSKDKDGYMIQIIESDARAFENDCLGKNESGSTILNLVNLD